MKILYPTVLSLTLASLLMACNKEPVKPTITTPTPAKGEATLTRSYIVSGANKHDTSYISADSLAVKAYYWQHRIFIDISSKIRNSGYVDGMLLDLDTAKLKPGLTGQYSLNSSDYPNRWNTNYSLMFRHSDGGEEWRGVVTDLGYEVKGILNINRYEAATQTIQGSFTIETGNMAHIRNKPYTVLTNQQAIIKATGNFTGVKLQR